MKPQKMDEMKRIYLKTLMDTASAEEQTNLSAYLKANPEAEGQLKNFAKQELARVRDYDPSAVKQDMPFVSSGENKVRSIFSLKKLVAAAAILLLIPLSWLIFRQYTADDWIQYAAHSGKGFETIELSDGSMVQLQDGSVLFVDGKYGQGKNRRLKLTGTAFFEVHRDTTSPFTIQTKEATVRVLGTSFNVSADSSQTSVGVKTGRVKVTNTSLKQEVVLIKGQGATSNARGIKTYQISDLNVDSWFTGNFVFEGTGLDQVIQSLNTYYNNRFVLAEGSQKTCKLTASFNKVPIEEVVEVLTLSCNLTMLNEKDRYVLK